MLRNSTDPFLPSRLRCLAASLLLLALLGCSGWRHGSHWSDGGGSPLFRSASVRVSTYAPSAHEFAPGLPSARKRFDLAEALAAENSARCVDEFYAAALLSWAEYRGAAPRADFSDNQRADALELYHESIGRLIREGQAHGRLDPRVGLVLEDARGRRVIPVEFHDFTWAGDDFQQWVVVGSYRHKAISQAKTCGGVGVPLVIVRRKPNGAAHECDFFPTEATFAATAVLAPDGSALALHNPLRAASINMAGEQFPMARDTTANIVWGLHHRDVSGLEGFLRPYRPGEAGRLYFMEPYQAHKVPLIFVHGLLSSPQTWADIYNELRASPDVNEKYQVWAFYYSTGAPFVRSAAELRAQLNEVQARFDPHSQHAALRRAVLVGHSMGGLVSKLMVSHSGDDVWNSVANLPLERVATSEKTRARLAERFYFDPQPMVARAVFIATPHRGSALAGRAIGQLAGALVSESDPVYTQLMRDNIGGFKDHVSRRMPTSIDLLDPTQLFLDTIGRLRTSPCVTMHSIIGDGIRAPGLGDSDGIVSVESARHPGVASELHVPASHSGILRHTATVEEIKRILRLHAAAAPAGALHDRATIIGQLRRPVEAAR
jgi:triacylglycerol esterase/lipase EstA (alpha/beta hydrolase family)